jgi:hypothetical protein
MKEKMSEIEIIKYAQGLSKTFMQRWDIFAKQMDDGSYICLKKSPSVNKMVEHIRGDVTLGAYLLDIDNQARYVVIDADDDENFEKLLDIPNEIPSYLESSRRGGHLWMFLEEQVPGEKAKLFGQGVLQRYGIEAESFPKQGESKYGSLIRVPFGVHRKSGERYPFLNLGTWRDQMNEMMNPKTVPLETVEELQYHPQRIPPRIIYDATGSKWERVKKAIPVKDYVSEYVTLKGNVGHCPFHDDQKKSFGVNEEGNYWHCFAGCGGGSIIDFYMKMKDVDFVTAVNDLDKLLGG